MMEERKTPNMEHLAIGQHVKALRMTNKAVSVIGTIDALNDDGQTVVVKLDDSEHLETVHADDVTVLDKPKATIEELEKILNTEGATPVHVNPDGSVTPISFTTVNGKAI